MKRTVAVLFTFVTTVFGLIAATAPAHAATPPPSFAGEMVSGGNPDFDGPRPMQVTCNPDGSGTVTYDVTGTAYGPYPGTFQESGTLTFGPIMDEAGQSYVTSFQANFRIESPVGIVYGDRTLIPDDTIMEPSGYCTHRVNPDYDYMITTFQAAFTWEVTITTADSVYAESGTGSGSGYQYTAGQSTGLVNARFTTSTTGEPVFVAARTPTAAEQCKANGFTQYGIFKNQGDCIAFVATVGRNEPGQNIPG